MSEGTEDLSAKARRGELHDADRRRLQLALHSSLEARLLHRAGVRAKYALAVYAIATILFTIGLLAGLVGAAVLQAHCPLLEAEHMTVWHAAIPAVSTAAGYGCGKLAERKAGGLLIAERQRRRGRAENNLKF